MVDDDGDRKRISKQPIFMQGLPLNFKLPVRIKLALMYP